jgi:hypothetical protein
VRRAAIVNLVGCIRLLGSCAVRPTTRCPPKGIVPMSLPHPVRAASPGAPSGRDGLRCGAGDGRPGRPLGVALPCLAIVKSIYNTGEPRTVRDRVYKSPHTRSRLPDDPSNNPERSRGKPGRPS